MPAVTHLVPHPIVKVQPVLPEGPQVAFTGAAHVIKLISQGGRSNRANLVIFEFNVEFQGLNINGLENTELHRITRYYRYSHIKV